MHHPVISQLRAGGCIFFVLPVRIPGFMMVLWAGDDLGHGCPGRGIQQALQAHGTPR